ncbi:MAG: DeoR/GlpR transcriptional regulator [Methylobacteriaceae bacterium]|nr:DeoR/GlpR transcriptional regulator [Methylobacteriaceae bacterium]
MARLVAAQRHAEILRRLEAVGGVRVEDLAAALDVSGETIRRDLKGLAARGRLVVVHGGAVGAEEAEFAARRADNPAGKRAIARRALDLAPDGASLLLDSGTTTLALAQALARAGRRLTVHTTSLPAAIALARAPGVVTHLIGGEFDPRDDATRGEAAARAVAALAVDIAFVGVGGFDRDGAVTDYSRDAARLRGLMLAAARQAWFLADRGKFALSQNARVEGRAAGLVADRPPPPALARALKARGCRVLTPQR